MRLSAEPDGTVSPQATVASMVLTVLLLLLPAASAKGDADSLRGVVGHEWVLTTVMRPDGDLVDIPASVDASFTINANHEMLGIDGCAGFNARVRLHGASMSVSMVGMNANSCVADGGPRDAAREAFGGLIAGQPVTASKIGNVLLVYAGNYRLAFRS